MRTLRSGADDIISTACSRGFVKSADIVRPIRDNDLIILLCIITRSKGSLISLIGECGTIPSRNTDLLGKLESDD